MISEAQRKLTVELFTALAPHVPEFLAAWREAADKDPPRPPSVEPESFHQFTTIRRLPCDMKPEDGSLRYCVPPPFPGAQMSRLQYFYEPAPPTGHPTLLVVAAWSVPESAMAEAQVMTAQTQAEA